MKIILTSSMTGIDCSMESESEIESKMFEVNAGKTLTAVFDKEGKSVRFINKD